MPATNRRWGAERAGLDVEAMRAEFESAARGGQDGALERFEEARARW